MVKGLYLFLSDLLLSLPEVKFVDLWNENVQYLQDTEVFRTPAVFIEFKPMKWNTVAQRQRRGYCTISLHIVNETVASSSSQSTKRSKALERFDLVEKIKVLMCNTSPENGDTITNTASITNHNHNSIVEDIEEFSCLMIDDSNNLDNQYVKFAPDLEIDKL